MSTKKRRKVSERDLPMIADDKPTLERELWEKARMDRWESLTAEQLAFAVREDVEEVAWILTHSRSFRELVVLDANGRVIPGKVAYRPESSFRKPSKTKQKV